MAFCAQQHPLLVGSTSSDVKFQVCSPASVFTVMQLRALLCLQVCSLRDPEAAALQDDQGSQG